MVSDRAAMESFILVDLFVIDVIEVDVIVALDAFFSNRQTMERYVVDCIAATTSDKAVG